MTQDFPRIEIRLKELPQLFNSLDPSPFYERDLDQDAEDFIVGWALEFPQNSRYSLVVHVPKSELERADSKDVEGAIHRHFERRHDLKQKELKEFLRVGRRSLTVGLGVLATCFALGGAVSNWIPQGVVQGLVQESLLILGWVANWRPIEIFLYDWWPIARRRNLFRQLSTAPVLFEPH